MAAGTVRAAADGRLRLVYRLLCDDAGAARARAGEIALEQTVELPPACVPDGLREAIVGRVEEVSAAGPGHFRAVLSYDPEVVGAGCGQLVNLLFGNISLVPGILLESAEWPSALLARLPGPRFGIPGLRELAQVTPRRALLCAAVKPLGLSARQLAERCRRFAQARVDIVKDDHSLAEQRVAPFRERVERCQEEVVRANRTGGGTLYFPHLSGGPDELARKVEWLRQVGVRGVLVSPLLLGWETVSWLARESGLAILGHPSATGAYFGVEHGIVPELLLGELFRLAGCDGVVYPNAGGRFSFTLATCEAINRGLRAPLGELRPAFPVPGGGIDRGRMPQWVERYGPDTIFLIGGSLYSAPDPEAASRELAELVRRAPG